MVTTPKQEVLEMVIDRASNQVKDQEVKETQTVMMPIPATSRTMIRLPRFSMTSSLQRRTQIKNLRCSMARYTI